MRLNSFERRSILNLTRLLLSASHVVFLQVHEWLCVNCLLTCILTYYISQIVKTYFVYLLFIFLRDVHETLTAETETRPRRWTLETETRPRRWPFCPRRDRDRDVPYLRRDRDETETKFLSSINRRIFHRRMQ